MKKGQELSLNTLIVIILLVIVLIVVAVFFLGGTSSLSKSIRSMFYGNNTDLSMPTKDIPKNTACKVGCDYMQEVIFKEQNNNVTGFLNNLCAKKCDERY